MQTLKFTEKTDVWAFAIVLLEVYTDGLNPFSELSNHEVMMQVQSNYVATKVKMPDACDERMFALMQSCWSIEPADRPTFSSLSATLLRGDEVFGWDEPSHVDIVNVDKQVHDNGNVIAPDDIQYVVQDSAAAAAAAARAKSSTMYSMDGSFAGGGDAESAAGVQYVVQDAGAAAAARAKSSTMYSMDGSFAGGGDAESAAGVQYVVQDAGAAAAARAKSSTMYSMDGSIGAELTSASAGYVVRGDPNAYAVGGNVVGGSEDGVQYVVRGNAETEAAKRAAVDMYSVGGNGSEGAALTAEPGQYIGLAETSLDFDAGGESYLTINQQALGFGELSDNSDVDM